MNSAAQRNRAAVRAWSRTSDRQLPAVILSVSWGVLDLWPAGHRPLHRRLCEEFMRRLILACLVIITSIVGFNLVPLPAQAAGGVATDKVVSRHQSTPS